MPGKNPNATSSSAGGLPARAPRPVAQPSDQNPLMVGPTDQGTPYSTAEENLLSDVNEAILSPADILYSEEQVAKWTEEGRGWIPFAKVIEDEEMVRGQSRLLDNGRVVQYMEEVRPNPKRQPLEDLLAIPTSQRGMLLV
jgi:hypothetical protein